MSVTLRLAGSALVLLATLGPAEAPAASGIGERCRAAVAKLLASFDEPQTERARLELDSPHRQRWSRHPAPRAGIALHEMSVEQRALVSELLGIVLSPRGLARVEEIRREQDVLAKVEDDMGRDYFWLAVFGEPAAAGRWSWRLGGHHVSMHFTFEDDRLVSCTPFSLSSEAVLEERSGRNALERRASLARELVASLAADAAHRAIVSEAASGRLERSEVRAFRIGEPEGLAASALTEEQRATLLELVADYFLDLAPAISKGLVAEVRALPVGDLHFAWAGPVRGEDANQAYRVQGPDFLLEWSGSRAHDHSVWRRSDDFGG